MELSNVVATVATATAGLTTALWIQSKTDIASLGKSTKCIETSQKTMESDLKQANDKLRIERKRNEDLVEQNRVLLREKQEVYKKLKLSEMEKSVLETDKEIASKDLALAVHQKTLLEEEIQNPSRVSQTEQEIKLRDLLEKAERSRDILETNNAKLQSEVSDIKTQLTMVNQDNEKKTEELHYLTKENISLQLQYEHLLKTHRKLGGSDRKDKRAQDVEDMEKKLLLSKLAMARQENERLKMECSNSSFGIKVKDIIEILKEKKILEDRLQNLEKETREIREEICSPNLTGMSSHRAQLFFETLRSQGDHKDFVRRHRSYTSQSKHLNLNLSKKETSLKNEPHKCQLGKDNRHCKEYQEKKEALQGHASDHSVSCCCKFSDLKEKLAIIQQMGSQISMQTGISEKTLKLSQTESRQTHISESQDTVFIRGQNMGLEIRNSGSTIPQGLEDNMRKD